MTPDQLKAFRVERGLSQGDLAALLGIARSTFVGYERGNSPIPKMLSLAVSAIHTDAPEYEAPAGLLLKVRAKSFRRITTRVQSPSVAIDHVV